ncbi:hypothetical protein D9M68_799470 [compost metagenome]
MGASSPASGGLRRDSRARLAASLSSSLPARAAAFCSSTGRPATAAAALSEMVPALSASTSSGVACFWIFSICTTWLLLNRAALAMSSRLCSGLGAGATGLSGGGSGLVSSAATSSGDGAEARKRERRSAMISRLRKASTPRWKSETLRRPRCWSIIHRCTSSIDWKWVFCTV